MGLLLDTHVLLWGGRGDPRLNATARDAIADPDNTIYVSAASPWEIAIKSKKGKLKFGGSPSKLIEANGFLPLPITPEHAETAGSLEWDHPDPFDRVLVGQARKEGLVLVHADHRIRAFGEVGELWAR